MTSQKPTLINDSVLANSIFDLLQKSEKPLSTTEIAENILDIKNLSSQLAGEMVRLIVNGDSRFVCTHNESWKLANSQVSLKRIKDIDYTALDVEIVGHARSPQIIEIAAYRIHKLEIIDEFCTFVNPGRAIIPKILKQLSGEIGQVITTETLQDAPDFENIVTDFFDFIGNSILVAHNAHFDLRMINRELKRLGYQKLVNLTIDTLKISRKFIKGTDTQKLSNLAYYFGIPVNEVHLAREDAKVLAKIFLQLISLLDEANIAQLVQLSPFLITL